MQCAAGSIIAQMKIILLMRDLFYFADVFPQPFEGCKLAINKGLSNHFQVSHTLQLSGMGPGAYHFGATYVGNKQTGPNEVQVVFYMYFHIVLGAAAIKGTPGAREFSWLP